MIFLRPNNCTRCAVGIGIKSTNNLEESSFSYDELRGTTKRPSKDRHLVEALLTTAGIY